MFCIPHKRKYSEYKRHECIYRTKRHECVSRKPSLIRLEIKYKTEQIFAHRMFDRCLLVQRYRSLIFRALFIQNVAAEQTHSLSILFGANCGIIHQDLNYTISLSKGQQVKKSRWKQCYSQVFIMFKQEPLDTSILASTVHLKVIYLL